MPEIDWKLVEEMIHQEGQTGFRDKVRSYRRT